VTLYCEDARVVKNAIEIKPPSYPPKEAA
jgi:hypothetical protein